VPARPSLSRLPSILRRELRKSAIAENAPAMQAYMKSAMPYLGVSAVPMRAVCKRVFADHAIVDAAAWRRDALEVWRGAQYREERYAAIELTGDKRARPFQTMDALPMYEEMIVSGAWWDTVDSVAVHRLDALLRADPRSMKKTMRAWSRSSDMWKRRSAIICQVTFKKETDTDLLYACIEPAIASKEFFLRKAIGWALRAYAWHAPDEVVRYVRAHEGELSGLSKREALKNVGRPKRG
jgi:3-methyladenine DNA glycosylase AlkD